MFGKYHIDGHTAALIPPLQPHLSSSSLPPDPITLYHLLFSNHPFALSPTRIRSFFIFFMFTWFIFHKTSIWLWTHITRGWVGHLQAASCHRWITFSLLFAPLLSCRPSHASGEPTEVHMTMLCSQTAMNNGTEVRYAVAEGRGRERETPGAHTGQRALQQGGAPWRLPRQRQLPKRINQTLLQQGMRHAIHVPWFHGKKSPFSLISMNL